MLKLLPNDIGRRRKLKIGSRSYGVLFELCRDANRDLCLSAVIWRLSFSEKNRLRYTYPTVTLVRGWLPVFSIQ